MKRITHFLIFFIATFGSINSYAGVDPTTAWWNGETFESITAGTDQKTGWTNNGGSPFVMTQTLGAQVSGSATGIVLGFPIASSSAFAESSAQSGGRGVYKTFTNALSGYVYVKTSFYQSTSGTTYTLKNTAGTTVFEFGGNGWSSGTTLWTTATANTLVAMGTRAKWADIEFVLDIANSKLDTLNISFAGTTKSYTKTNLAAATDVKSLYVSMTRSYCGAGLDNTTFGQLTPNNIKTLSGISSLQTNSTSAVTTYFNVLTFTNAMGKDYIIPKTDLDIVWSISDYGTLSSGDQALVTLTRSASDTRIATLSAGSITADATITLSAVYGATTITKQVLVKNLSVAGLKSGLADEIAAANLLMTAASDSNPYIIGIKSTLTGYVNAAQAVIDNSSATIEEASTALSNIQSGNTAFSTAMTPYNDFLTYIASVQTAHDAEARTVTFITTIKNTLNTAIQDATTARTTISSEVDITSAKTALQNAITQFNADVPAYANLEAQITSVTNRLAVVNPRKGDSQFLMFPTATVDALNNAKTSAEGVLSSATTATQLNTAKTDLETALTTFNVAPRVAPNTTDSFYQIYSYGSDGGDGGTTKMILYADEAGTLKYATVGNAVITNSNSRWAISEPTTGKYTFKNVGTQSYLNGLTLNATAMEFTLPEGYSQTNLIQAGTDPYFQYYIVNPSSKGLEIDLFDTNTNTGVFVNNSAVANRFRFCYQFEAVSIVSSTNNTQEKTLRIYPSMTRDNVTIESANATSADIISITGQIVKQVRNINSKATVNMTDLSNGSYLVKVRFEDGSVKVQNILFQK